MPIGWKFPSNNKGTANGLNDSGISYFEANPVRSLAKEVLQDSLDAIHPDEERVIVKFTQLDVPKNELPDIEGLLSIFKMGAQHWEHHDDTRNFFEKGIEVLSKDEISILSIRDYNTTGLSRVGKENHGGWFALVKSTGVTEKAGTAGGSFGIGKHAPFAASTLRTMIYGTKNYKEEVGLQGVSKLATFTDQEGNTTQGTGFFGFKEDLQPLAEVKDIASVFKRDEYGTDKFIIGFENKENWSIELIEEAVSSYMLAIYEGKMEIHVNGYVINSEGLGESMEMIREHYPSSLALQYYEVLTSEESKKVAKKFRTDQGEEEDIILYLLAKEGFKKRVALHRSTGMKIDDKGHFRTPMDFAGVLTVQGQRLNEILRRTEPPTHDKWIPERFKENEAYAKKLIKEMNSWMAEETRKLLTEDLDGSIEIQGAAQLLPDLTTQKEPSIVVKESKRNYKPTIHQPKQRRTPRAKGFNGEDEDGALTKSGVREKSGEQSNQNEGSSNDKKTKMKVAKIAQLRVFLHDADKRLYRMIIMPQTTGQVTLVLKAVGENGHKENMEIQESRFIYDNKQEEISVKDNKIGPISLSKSNRTVIEFKLNTPNRVSLEVIKE